MHALGAPLTGPSGQMLPLSAGVEAGGFVFVSGQLAMVGGHIVGDDVAAQTSIALDGLEAVLKEAGLGLGDIVRTGIWLTRAEDFAAFNAVYSARLKAPYPARATVVSALVVPGALVEIEAIAWRSDAARQHEGASAMPRNDG